MRTNDALEEIKRVAADMLTDEQREKETHVVIVLDSSGSMGSIKTETIGAFNGFVDTIAENAAKGGTTTVTLVVFGELGKGIVTKFRKEPAGRLVKLTEETYKPGAYTPLYDGIGQGINEVRDADVSNKDTAFLVQIFTDGYENASREWSATKLRETITKLQNKGNWTFTFAGANINVNDFVDNIGILRANAISFRSTSGGMQGMSVTNNIGTQAYFGARDAGLKSVSSYYGGTGEAPELDKSYADMINSLQNDEKDAAS